MTIKAKYESKCSKCGGRIKVGDTIEWEPGLQVYHTICPENIEEPVYSYGKSWVDDKDRYCDICGKNTHGTKVHYRYPGKTLVHVDCKLTSKQVQEEQLSAPLRLFGGSGDGSNGWVVGQTLKTDKRRCEKGWPEYVTVVKAGSRYYREDGLSFGVGDDSGYTYWADCREATEVEIAPVRARIEAKDKKLDAKKEVEVIADKIRTDGNRPNGWHNPQGIRLIDTQNIYGGGSWFLLNKDEIWYCINNGSDGDDWSNNNFRTGGAGAIGWVIPYNDTVGERLITLESILNPNKDLSAMNSVINEMFDSIRIFEKES